MGSLSQTDVAVTGAEIADRTGQRVSTAGLSQRKGTDRPFSLAGRIIARVIICQLVLTAALTAVAVLYARRELGRGFDAALNGWAVNTLAAVRYTETESPDLLFDPSLLPPSSNPRHPDLFEIRRSNGDLLAQSGGPIPAEFGPNTFADFAVNGISYRAITLRQVPVLDREDNITVPETEREVTYAVVRRYLSGRWVYVLEHFAARTKSTNENHCGVDCAVQFGGTQPTVSLSFDGTTFTASAAIFAAGDVGKVISYRSGKAIIASFNSSTSVDVTVINEFVELEIPYLDVYKDIPSGEWWLIDLVTSVRLPLNFRPASVTIYGDGKLFEDVAVAANGTVTFEEELGFGYIGLGFTCLAVTLPASANGTVIEMSRKNIKGVGLRYVDSKGLEAGTSEDDTYPIEKIQPDIMTEATLLNSAIEEITISSEWDADTQIYIKANGAYPTQVTGIVLDLEVGDDVD